VADSERARDFAVQQMLHGLDRQASVLSELRQRASIVLSATGIIASLLGAAALKGDYSKILAIGALLSTAAGMVACIAVLWRVSDEGKLPADPDAERASGTRGWKVTVSWKELEDLVASANDPSVLLEDLALARRVNYRTLKRRSKLFVLASSLLVVQFTAWSVTFLEGTW
jgi:hypothetical protein